MGVPNAMSNTCQNNNGNCNVNSDRDTSDRKIRVVLVGGSGDTGFEVIKILARHPHAELVGVFGPENELGAMEGFYPHLSKLCTLDQELFEPAKLKDMGALIESDFTAESVAYFALAHPGTLGTNNRGREQVEKDWQRLANRLDKAKR